MRVVVCVKVVPTTKHNRRIDGESGRLVRDAGVMGEPDRHALEEALALRDAGLASEVVIAAMAPSPASGALRDGLAMGADRALHVTGGDLSGSDLLATSAVLAEVAKREAPGVILFGSQGEDSAGGALAAAVAARLGIAVVSQGDGLEVEGDVARVRRQTERGYETVTARMPCIISVTDGINSPRFASVKGKLAARTKTITMLSGGELGMLPQDLGASGSGTKVRAVVPPPSRRPATIVEGATDPALQIYEYLRAKEFLS